MKLKRSMLSILMVLCTVIQTGVFQSPAVVALADVPVSVGDSVGGRFTTGSSTTGSINTAAPTSTTAGGVTSNLVPSAGGAAIGLGTGNNLGAGNYHYPQASSNMRPANGAWMSIDIPVPSSGEYKIDFIYRANDANHPTVQTYVKMTGATVAGSIAAGAGAGTIRDFATSTANAVGGTVDMRYNGGLLNTRGRFYNALNQSDPFDAAVIRGLGLTYPGYCADTANGRIAVATTLSDSYYLEAGINTFKLVVAGTPNNGNTWGICAIGYVITLVTEPNISVDKHAIALNLLVGPTTEDITAYVADGWSGLTFTSSNESVASVATNGLTGTVTAVGVGTADITATVTDGEQFASDITSVTVSNSLPPPIEVSARSFTDLPAETAIYSTIGDENSAFEGPATTGNTSGISTGSVSHNVSVGNGKHYEYIANNLNVKVTGLTTADTWFTLKLDDGVFVYGRDTKGNLNFKSTAPGYTSFTGAVGSEYTTLTYNNGTTNLYTIEVNGSELKVIPTTSGISASNTGGLTIPVSAYIETYNAVKLYVSDASMYWRISPDEKKITINELTIKSEYWPEPEERRMTPIMGWSSWNSLGLNISESAIKAQVDALVSTGMRDAGYIYVNIDDGYQKGRDDVSGLVNYDTTKFPKGMKELATYMHQVGIKGGMYSDAGDNTCGSGANTAAKGNYGFNVGFWDYRGWDNADKDARMYLHNWGYDFIKVDWCGGRHLGLNQQARYTAISNSIRQVAAEDRNWKVFNICCWSFPGAWAVNVADSWRTSGDISANWTSVLNCLDTVKSLAQYHGPGHVNDPDMMEVGNGSLTETQNRSHFSMWCMVSAPLITGNDLRRLTAPVLNILTNKELIAIDQDPACLPARVVRTFSSGNGEVWVKPLGSADSPMRAVALLNRSGSAITMSVDWAADLGMDGVSSVRDLWLDLDLTPGSGYSASIPAYGVVVLKVVAAASTVRLDKNALELTTNGGTGSVQLNATVKLMADNGDTLPNTGVSWTSSDPAVATVDNTGLVTAVGVGTANITATSKDNATLSDICVVTVREYITLTAISLPDTLAINAGGSAALAAAFVPADATVKDLIWSSGSPTVATVSSSGVVTGLRTGTVTIKATSAANPAISASCIVVVIPVDVGVSIGGRFTTGATTSGAVNIAAPTSTTAGGVMSNFVPSAGGSAVGLGSGNNLGAGNYHYIQTGSNLRPANGSWESIDIPVPSSGNYKIDFIYRANDGQHPLVQTYVKMTGATGAGSTSAGAGANNALRNFTTGSDNAVGDPVDMRFNNGLLNPNGRFYNSLNQSDPFDAAIIRGLGLTYPGYCADSANGRIAIVTNLSTSYYLEEGINTFKLVIAGTPSGGNTWGICALGYVITAVEEPANPGINIVFRDVMPSDTSAAAATVLKNDIAGEICDVILAVYDAAGRLVDVDIKHVTVPDDGEPFVVSNTVDVQLLTGYTAKVMVWKDYVPIADTYVVLKT